MKHSAASRISFHRIAKGIAYTGILLGILCTQHAMAAPRSARNKVAHVKLPPPEMHRDSSRFLNTEKKEEFLMTTTAKLNMSDRDTDPFALPQDPEAKPPEPTTVASIQAQADKPKKIPFAQIIGRIRITTIIPKEKRFLIDSRSFQAGDSLSLRFQGKVIDAKVESVSAAAIILRNQETDEVGAIPINLLPTGMQAGITKLDSDDIFQGNSDSPILLDSSQQEQEESSDPLDSFTPPPSPFSP